MKKLLLLTFTVLYGSCLLAQEHHEEADPKSELENGRHSLAIYTGFTHVSSAFYEHETHVQSTGKWVPTIGVDYFYSLNEKWHIGFIGDMEFDNYYIRLEDESEEERLNVIVASLVAGYKLTHHWFVFAGPGIETEFSESNKNFFVMKFGVSYDVEIANGWAIAPSLMYDYKQEYQTVAYGLSIGKRF